MRSGALAVVLSLAVAASAGAETRTPTDWPFKDTSPWNAPLGTGAQYLSPLCDVQLHGGETQNHVPWINANQYSFPVYPAVATDPGVNVLLSANPSDPTQEGTSQGTYAIPANATQADGSDRSMIVQEPGGLFDDESWLTYRYGTYNKVGGFSRHDLKNGDGWQPLKGYGIRAANASALGGLIRTKEVQTSSIRHALAISLTQARMMARAVPPATGIDNHHEGYTGTIPMGQLFGIPLAPGTPVSGVTTPLGRAIVTALESYGAYVVDTGGNFAFYAEPSSESLLGSTRGEVPKILAAMKCVSNNNGPPWGGGGTPVAPKAPPFG